MKRLSFLVALVLLLVPAIASALDYKVCLPLVPETLNNMSQKGDPGGMNMSMETPEQVMKTISISGYNVLLILEKKKETALR